MSADLKTRYLGLTLKNPIVPSAGPLAGKLDTAERLAEAGASALVLPSLFEEQVEHEESAIHRLYEFGTESFPEALSYLPDVEAEGDGPERYLDHIRTLKSRLSIPIIASLNGHSVGGWTRYAKLMEEAGADAIELNIYFVPTSIHESSTSVETRYLDLVREVRKSVSVPVSVKLGPSFTALPEMCQRLSSAGANGLVLFNRWVESDIDLEHLAFRPHLKLSESAEVRVPLRWIAILSGQLNISLAASSGVHAPADVIKLLLAGADVAMTTSALLKNGPEHLTVLIGGLAEWLDENEYESVEQMKGSMNLANCRDPSALQRANYMKALFNYTGDFI